MEKKTKQDKRSSKKPFKEFLEKRESNKESKIDIENNHLKEALDMKQEIIEAKMQNTQFTTSIEQHTQNKITRNKRKITIQDK